jgi:hypothetical protein
MKKRQNIGAASPAAATTVNVLGLSMLYSFAEDPRRKRKIKFNVLLTDSDGRLYLASEPNCSRGMGEIVTRRDGQMAPIANVSRADLQELSLKRALQWFVECYDKCPDSYGETGALVEMAANALPDQADARP